MIKRKPGQRSLLITTPGREINHVDIAHRVCSFDRSIRPFVLPTGLSVGAGPSHWGNTCHWQTHRNGGAAGDGIGSARPFPNVSSSIESRHLVNVGGQSDFVVLSGTR